MTKTNRFLYGALAVFLCLCMSAAVALPALAEGTKESSADAEKAESVYVQADAEGNVRSVTVEAVLDYGGDGATIDDVSYLNDIKNTEGDEEFTQGANSALVWEDHGEKIRYEGSTDRALPVTVHVSYYLNGALISPDELAGKSGRVRIRFDYENNTAETVTVTHPADDDGEQASEDVETCVPFLALSLAMLPDDVFSHVEVTNGRLLTLGDQTVAVGYAFPGLSEHLSLDDCELTEDTELPEYVEFEADAEDFSLDFTATVVMNGLFSDLDPEELDDLDELADGADKLKEASEKLADGARELSDGAAEFSGYIAQYADGAGRLADGAAQLTAGISAIDTQKGALLEGAQGLQDGLEALQDAVSGISAPDTGAATAALTSILTDISSFSALLTQLQGELSGFADYTAAVDGAVSAAQSSLAGIDLDLSAALDSLSLTDEQRRQAAAALSGVVSAAQSGIAEAQGHLSDVPAAPAAPDTAAYAASVAALADDLAAQATELQNAAATLSVAAALPDTLIQTVSMLSDGSAQLTAGVSALADGLGELADGSAALSTGAAALKDSGGALKTAAAALVDGSDALADGMEEFDAEGVSELTDLIDDGFAALVTELRALRQADLSYDNFGGIADGRTGSVRFIIETDEIK